MSKFYQLKTETSIHADISTVWDFFSSPMNLRKITPKKLNFKIKTTLPEKAHKGLMIGYTVSPILGIPLNWLTEITQLKENRYFVDEQRIGPYKLWHHEHIFEVMNEKVVMKDIVTYSLPFGILGRFAHWLFIKKEIESIFSYREKIITEIFKNTN